jgi:CYTH domain-containing protein
MLLTLLVAIKVRDFNEEISHHHQLNMQSINISVLFEKIHFCVDIRGILFFVIFLNPNGDVDYNFFFF